MTTETLTFNPVAVTKNTVKFHEVDRPGKPQVMGTLYLQKWFCDSSKVVDVQVIVQVRNKDNLDEPFKSLNPATVPT